MTPEYVPDRTDEPDYDAERRYRQHHRKAVRQLARREAEEEQDRDEGLLRRHEEELEL